MRLLWVVFLIFLPGISPILSAQPNKDTVKQLAKDGAKAYEADQFQEALRFFLEAHQLSQEFKYLPPIGQCYDQLGKFQEAINAYQQFLQEAPPEHPLREEVEKKLAYSEYQRNKLAPTSKAAEPPYLPTKKTSRKLAIVAISAGALTLIPGAFAILPQTGDLQDFQNAQALDELQQKARQQFIFAVVADTFLLTAISTGVASRIIKKRESTAWRLSPTSVSFAVQW